MARAAVEPSAAEANLQEPEGRATTTDVLTISQISAVWVYGTGLLVIVGLLVGSRPILAVGVVLAAALAIAWLWARWCFANLTVERHFTPERAFWGEEIEMAHVFTNAKILPVAWLGVQDQYPSHLKFADADNHLRGTHTNRLQSSLAVGWFERATKRYKLTATARGEHEFGPIEMQSGDVFGLFRRQVTYATPETLLVYPRYVPVEHLGISARQPFGDFKAILHLATDPVRVRGVREYEFGDSPRSIHWKATARRGTAQTKLFEPAATPQITIFCNQSTFAQVREGLDTETLELAIVAAASLAAYALDQGYLVGLQVNAFAAGTDRQVKLAPGRDSDQFTRILEELARIKGWSGLTMEDLLRAERHNMPLGMSLVVVTGILNDELLDVLLSLRRSGHPVTVVETVGSRRALESAEAIPAEVMQEQGITYYRIDAIGQADHIEELNFR
jgi:uncharacterized protein (DUF58 family)